MKSIFFLASIFVLGTLAAPALQAQAPAASGKGKGQGHGQQMHKRDGSCTPKGQGCGQGRGQGVRKQDGTGPRAGTAGCVKTPKAPAK
ncbi:MAG: hypothetical protein Q8O00_02275 [Holophaga sp.]|nr:hypothetical protein [Holophaga sp.]